jgi:PEP-CTERM motif
MKNKYVLLSSAILSASLLAPMGAFAEGIQIDDLLEGNLSALTTGFDPASLVVTVNQETLTGLGVVDLHGAWVSPYPFDNGQAQTYRFNIWDPAFEGGLLSDTLMLTLTGQQANPNNMIVDLSFRSDNLAGGGLDPMSGAIDIIESGGWQSLDAWLPSQLTMLEVSFRSEVPEPSSLALLGLGGLSLLSYASRKRRLAA